MPRRKLDKRELRFLLWSTEIDERGDIQPDAQLHVVRQLHYGNLIPACDWSAAILSGSHVGYFTFPFLNWIADHAKVCGDCRAALIAEGVMSNKQRELA